MRKLRICIYGGTDLPERAADFITHLSHAILKSLDAVIVTGGFLHFEERKECTSTDHAALKGAQAYAQFQEIPLQDCFEAWVPSPELDRTQESGGVVRMSEKDQHVTVRVMGGKSALGRRLALVRQVDALITIAGRRHTELVLEQALEIDTPALPLAFAEGDSKTFWDANEAQIRSWFSLSDETVRTLREVNLENLPEKNDEIMAVIIDALRSARIGRCLVLLPYDEIHDKLYREVIEPAVDSVMISERLDHHPSSEIIRNNFVEKLETCCAVIGDVTVISPNVMYEIGYVHAKGIEPFLFRRSRIGEDQQLPVYVRDLNIIAKVDLDKELAERIQAYLFKVKFGRGNTFS